MAVASPMSKVVFSNAIDRAKTPPCPSHSQKWLTPSLASGLPTLQLGQRGLTKNIAFFESVVGRQPHV